MSDSSDMGHQPWMHETVTELRRREMRSEIIKIAATLVRLQHIDVSELEPQDMPQFGDLARRLKKVADQL